MSNANRLEISMNVPYFLERFSKAPIINTITQ